MLQRIKGLLEKSKRKTIALATMAVMALTMAVGSASANPSTGDADLDTMLTTFEGAFSTVKTAFVYIALAAIPITLIVLAFFWIRGKVKQAVTGA